MVVQFRPLLCLSLLVASCDKPAKHARAPDHATTPARVTKSVRPGPEAPENAQASLREHFKTAAATASPEQRNQLLAAVAWEALELDPDLAREAFQQLATGTEERNRLIEHFAMRLAEQNPEEALRWASALETEAEQSLAFGRIALVMAENEPERAARLLSDSGVAGREFDVATIQVLQRWTAKSPADAAAWVALFDAGDARSAGLKTVISPWISQSPETAIAWVESLADATLREEAELALADAISHLPAGAQARLLELAPVGLRDRLESLTPRANAE